MTRPAPAPLGFLRGRDPRLVTIGVLGMVALLGAAVGLAIVNLRADPSTGDATQLPSASASQLATVTPVASPPLMSATPEPGASFPVIPYVADAKLLQVTGTRPADARSGRDQGRNPAQPACGRGCSGHDRVPSTPTPTPGTRWSTSTAWSAGSQWEGAPSRGCRRYRENPRRVLCFFGSSAPVMWGMTGLRRSRAGRHRDIRRWSRRAHHRSCTSAQPVGHGTGTAGRPPAACPAADRDVPAGAATGCSRAAGSRSVHQQLHARRGVEEGLHQRHELAGRSGRGDLLRPLP